MLEGRLLVLLLAALHTIVLVGENPLFLHVGLGTVLLASLYVWPIFFMRKLDARSPWIPVRVSDLPEGEKSGGITIALEQVSEQGLIL